MLLACFVHMCASRWCPPLAPQLQLTIPLLLHDAPFSTTTHMSGGAANPATIMKDGLSTRACNAPPAESKAWQQQTSASTCTHACTNTQAYCARHERTTTLCFTNRRRHLQSLRLQRNPVQVCASAPANVLTRYGVLSLRVASPSTSTLLFASRRFTSSHRLPQCSTAE